MKGLIVSIVDVLGIFVPGFLLLIGILLFPSVARELSKEWPTSALLLAGVRDNFATLGILAAISSYVLGFIIRLSSISILQILTFPFWAEKLKKRVEKLEETLGAALKNDLGNDDVCKSLKAEACLRSRFEVARNAPYFAFAKRLIQNGNPSLWTGTERIEAELRFMAGIFLPLILLFLDGVRIASNSGYALATVSGVGVLIILLSFPTRRIREVVYNYHMALIVLHYPSRSLNAANSDAA
jgi:hypothetical protein